MTGSARWRPSRRQRVDYSLARLAHYTATDPEHFQNHVLFTNYQFYVAEFEAYRTPCAGRSGQRLHRLREHRQRGDHGPGRDDRAMPEKLPQMPDLSPQARGGCGDHAGQYRRRSLERQDGDGPHRGAAPACLDHGRPLRRAAQQQNLGDFVLAHAYLREDGVLDADLPTWVPIPALAEIQIALQEAVARETRLEGYDLKRVMRTGTVASLDNRNWELRDQSGPVQRLSQSRAIALDMESATIAANGFRFRVPYGTLLCVSDKPLHGELKLPGMASDFYKTQVARHLMIGIRAMEAPCGDMPLERIHSRKLRSFEETAFL